MSNHSFTFYGLAFFGIIFARYLILAGATHWLLYGILRLSTGGNHLDLADFGID